MMSARGVVGVERNGHHFFSGIQSAPAEQCAILLRRHGNNLTEDTGGVALRLAGGGVEIGSLARGGFGCQRGRHPGRGVLTTRRGRMAKQVSPIRKDRKRNPQVTRAAILHAALQ
ncbi:MAG: hypothetical protein KI788_04825 [Mameliella sp.]|nr:hypothetical protein [Mameliella sp.]MBV6649403.1 hypothetical protein [Hoeflea sp.]